VIKNKNFKNFIKATVVVICLFSTDKHKSMNTTTNKSVKKYVNHALIVRSNLTNKGKD
jgi:hypothetical protein